MTEVSAKYRGGDRHVAHERYDFLRPTIVHCTSTEPAIANTEYMFPFASVVQCPQNEMLKKIGGTPLVASCLTKDPKWSQGASGRDQHRPIEHWRGEDDSTALDAAARGKHHRLPVPGASVPEQPSARTLIFPERRGQNVISSYQGTVGRKNVIDESACGQFQCFVLETRLGSST